MGGFVTVTGYEPERVPPSADGASCVKRCWGKGFATEAAFGAPDTPENCRRRNWGADPAVTALTDFRGKPISSSRSKSKRSSDLDSPRHKDPSQVGP
jgi:hypothetical protein